MIDANQRLAQSDIGDDADRPVWTMTVGELKAYLGILIIANNILIVPRNERYFLAEDGKWLFHTNIRNIFSRKRFKEIQRHVHFVDPSLRRPQIGEPEYDRLFMIRPVLDHLQAKFKELYVLDRNISVDESMIPFKGQLSWIQRMPQKPVKVGIKVFVLAEASTGYCWNFSVDVGKNQSQNDDVGDLGKTDRVVIDLVADLTYQNYHLYLDNFYTSVPLLLFLSGQGILCCGTMWVNRKYYPKEELSVGVKQLKKGEMKWACYKNLTALLWKDSKPVFFLSSIHDASQGEMITRTIKNNEGTYEKVNINCPQLATDYNKNMLGVDRSDQSSVVKKDKKQKRFYMRIFIAFLMKTINNAHILEGHAKGPNRRGKPKRDLLSFKEELAMQLIGEVRANKKAGGRKRQCQMDTMENRLLNVGVHFPANGEGKDHTCIVCREKRKLWIRSHPQSSQRDCPTPLSKTVFCCTGCEPQNSVYLCIKKESNCFKDYHSKVEYWR